MAKTKNKFQVTFLNGHIATRGSTSTYTHAVVLKAVNVNTHIVSYGVVQWCKSEANAVKAVKSSWWSKNLGAVLQDRRWVSFEIVEVEQVK